MKKTLLLITALLLASTIDAQDLQRRISDKFRFHPQKCSAAFMSDGMVKMDMMQALFNYEGEFVENERTQFEYTGQGQVQTITYYELDESDDLVFDSRENYFYDDGFMIYELNEYYNQETDTWMLEDSVTYSYDGNLLVREDFFWYDMVNEEMDHDEITYYYYTATQLDSTILHKWNGAEYIPSQRELYQYDAGEVSMYIYSEADGSGIWYDFEKYTYNWQGGQLQEMNLQSFDEEVGSMVNDEKSVYTWQNNGNLDEMLFYAWSVVEEDWELIMRQYGGYNNDVSLDQMVLPFFADEEGNPLIYFTHQVDSVFLDMYDLESGWSQFGVYKFHYSDFVGINETTANTIALKVYPNPVKDRLNVNYLFERQTFALICDNLGRVIKNVVLQGVDDIDISELNSGFYYLVLTGGEHSGQVAKFIIE